MDIDSLCDSFNNKVSFFENEEYQILKENYNKLQTDFDFTIEFYEEGVKRYRKYLYNISCWGDRTDIEEHIYKYMNCNADFEAYKAMKYIDTELMKFLGEI